ncbi:LPS assembly lipoprotein LptE [Alteromonas flava]|uniref:LPS-assembly lipoprotein LptE n=1 Tax=Alteromonas flava TaxID=2048003 RepID=UPI000C2832E0|nr:LPS assembly lipoprotein LptE [Alteromonas flava]
MRQFALWICLSLGFLSLTGCGFALRGSQQFPVHIKQVEVRSLSAHDPQARALRERLAVYQLDYTRAATETELPNTVIIELRPENLTRRLLSVFRTGQVAEYELIYRIDYRVTFPASEAIDSSVEILREYQDDPDQVLAKSRELDLILDEMRADAADRMIRLMASQAPTVLSNQ